jgi:1-acyl-sn-glycerol-3-phosphate acyltransferase
MKIFRMIEKCGGRFSIRGLNNLKEAEGPVVIVSNHMGTLETMIFPFLIAPIMRVTFVVKDSLVKNKIFGPIMRSRNPIALSRSNSREDLLKVMTEGKKLLKDGISIIIFPQSTRQAGFDPLKFNSLGTKLASRAGAQVIPVAIKTDFWGNGKKIKELGPLNRDHTIFMDFGRPIDVEGTGKEAHQSVINHIDSNLKKWTI